MINKKIRPYVCAALTSFSVLFTGTSYALPCMAEEVMEENVQEKVVDENESPSEDGQDAPEEDPSESEKEADEPIWEENEESPTVPEDSKVEPEEKVTEEEKTNTEEVPDNQELPAEHETSGSVEESGDNEESEDVESTENIFQKASIKAEKDMVNMGESLCIKIGSYESDHEEDEISFKIPDSFVLEEIPDKVSTSFNNADITIVMKDEDEHELTGNFTAEDVKEMIIKVKGDEKIKSMESDLIIRLKAVKPGSASLIVKTNTDKSETTVEVREVEKPTASISIAPDKENVKAKEQMNVSIDAKFENDELGRVVIVPNDNIQVDKLSLHGILSNASVSIYDEDGAEMSVNVNDGSVDLSNLKKISSMIIYMDEMIPKGSEGNVVLSFDAPTQAGTYELGASVEVSMTGEEWTVFDTSCNIHVIERLFNMAEPSISSADLIYQAENGDISFSGFDMVMDDENEGIEYIVSLPEEVFINTITLPKFEVAGDMSMKFILAKDPKTEQGFDVSNGAIIDINQSGITQFTFLVKPALADGNYMIKTKSDSAMVVSVYNDMSAPGTKSFTADKKIANNEEFDTLTTVHSILFEKMKRPNDSETELPETEQTETEPETESVPTPAPKPNSGGTGNNNGGGGSNSNNGSDMPADPEPEKKPVKPEKDKTNDTTAAQDKTKEEALLNDRVNAIKNAALSSHSDTATGTSASVSLSNNRADSIEQGKNISDWRVVTNDEWKIRAIDIGLVSDIVPVRIMPIKESIVRDIISNHILDI